MTMRHSVWFHNTFSVWGCRLSFSSSYSRLNVTTYDCVSIISRLTTSRLSAV